MGEELELVSMVLKGPDGVCVPWDGLTTTEIDPEHSKDCEGEVYAHLVPTQKISGTIMIKNPCKHFMLHMFMGGNSRMVRRVLRWKERIRRDFLKGEHEIKREDWETVAILCAKKCGNNRRKK